jgi:hypothetical protein
MVRRVIALALVLLLLTVSGADAGGEKVSMLDRAAVAQGTAKVNLQSGSVKLKVALAPLPATIDTGADLFEATIYKAYLTHSTDPAIEVPLGDVYPNKKSKAKLTAAFKGDLSQFGFDRVLVVAFSKDGLNSFDVLTGTLSTE